MRLLKHSGAGWRYELEQREGLLLRMLVKEFPRTSATVARITRAGGDPKSAERERLLNESLVQHRKELKRQAGKLLAARLKVGKESWQLSLSVDEREVLLQVLNDIRVESWHALGEPEDLDTLPSDFSETTFRDQQFMHVAGYFEWKMLGDVVEGRETRGEG